MSTPLVAREELAARFIGDLLRGSITSEWQIPRADEIKRIAAETDQLATYAFALADAVVARRSPGA